MTMPTYNVLVTRECCESTTVRVEADDEETAEDKALELAKRNPEKYQWEFDEGNFNETYICDPGNCAQEVDPECHRKSATKRPSSGNPTTTARLSSRRRFVSQRKLLPTNTETR